MRSYKRLTMICGFISLLSLASCLFLHYFVVGEESDFWINICLAIFGSALLSALTSLVTYFHEKRSTLESFMYQCTNLLHVLNKYQDSMSLEDKMKFYLEYYDLDKSAWDAAYGNMDFFTEKIIGNRKYIYEKIYTPIFRFNQAVSNHAWHFRWYFDESGKNTSVMEMFVEQLEQYLLYRDEKSIPADYGKRDKIIGSQEAAPLESKLVREISKELCGKYYEIMYGKRRK